MLYILYTRDLHIFRFEYQGIMGPNPTQRSRENPPVAHITQVVTPVILLMTLHITVFISIS